jgi:succinyl-CoA synthetase beta subunit
MTDCVSSCVQVKEAFRIITEDVKVKAILVNVFGGIVNCATIANGIVNACKSIDLKVSGPNSICFLVL